MPEAEIVYREIDPDDTAEALAFLWTHEYTFRDSDPENYVEKTPEAMDRALASLRRGLAEQPGRHHCLGAFRGDDLVGAISLEVWNIDDHPAAHVHGLWVRPEDRKKGIASELKRRAEDWGRAAGCTQMDTNVKVTNAPMIALNERLGYTVARFNFRKPL